MSLARDRSASATHQGGELAPRGEDERLARALGSILIHALLILGALIMVAPFFWMISTSLKAADEAQAMPPTIWPSHPLWENYREAWTKPEVKLDPAPALRASLEEKGWPRAASLLGPYKGFAQYYWVSVSTTFLITLGTLATSILAGYAFAKMRFPGRGLFFYLVLATLMVPGQVLIIPNYILLAKLQWLDSYKALVVPWMASVFSIFLLRQFFSTVPDDLWDASQIDGAGRGRFIWHVLIPLSKPVLITSAIFNAVNNWNSLLWPLVVTNTAEMRTLMVGLTVFTSDAGSDPQLLMAASTFCILPVVIIFFLLQRFFIEGIARSGMKS